MRHATPAGVVVDQFRGVLRTTWVGVRPGGVRPGLASDLGWRPTWVGVRPGLAYDLGWRTTGVRRTTGVLRTTWFRRAQVPGP
ncbi:hypothetical protein ABN034_13415 [Actinopolymorpha sp. B11F2]|uniref:hypothetical protein n=1 Tax=Actinopolymorpha sp. B11F2 TaxID=3160862 RepID=UPI0032E523FC